MADANSANTPKAEPPPPTLREGVRMISRFAQGEHAQFAYAVIALIAAAALLALALLVPQSVFDVVLGDPALASNISRTIIDWMGGDARVRHALWIPAVVMIVITSLSGVAIHLKTRFATAAAERIARRTRDRMYDHVQRLPCSALDTIPSGDLVQRCTSDIEAMRAFLASQAPEMGRAVLMLLMPLPIMIMLDWRMAIASIVIIPAILAYTAINYKKMGPSFGAKEAAEARMTAGVTENLTGIRTVRAFGRAAHEEARFAETSAAFRDCDAHLFRLFAVFWSVSDLMCFVQQIIVVGLGAWMLSRGTLELGAYFYFLTVVGMFIYPVRMLGRMTVESGKALAAIARLDEILARKEERDLDPAPSEAITLAVSGVGLAVRFERVSFAHRGGPKVLDDLSFELAAGQMLGLVGPSGSGKTTILQLLLRLHEPDAGVIAVDGHPLARVARASIRGVVGTVLQQPFLYSKKLRENILAGTRAVNAHAATLEHAAHVACIHDTLVAFPEGYDTVVGEKGMTLSGGQRQRVAIARAIVQEPRLLVLDDALSAVDTHTEASILTALRMNGHDAKSAPTKIIVAHRLSAVMEADLILVLDGGRVVQRGTHAQLIASSGLYQTLWQIQTTVTDALGDLNDLVEAEVVDV